jgi:flagellar hook-length control protein FliK
MSSDSAINRIQATDPNDALAKRKSKGEQINVSQTSFFNELLNLSKFECMVVEPAEQPLPALPTVPANSSASSDEKVENTKEPAEKDAEAESDTGVDAEVYAAQLACQQNALNNNAADVQPDQAKPATEVVETSSVGQTDEEGPLEGVASTLTKATESAEAPSDQLVDVGAQEDVAAPVENTQAKSKTQDATDANKPRVEAEKTERGVQNNEHESRRNSKKDGQSNEVRGAQEKRSNQDTVKSESVASSANAHVKQTDRSSEVRQSKSESTNFDTEVEASSELGDVRNRRAERLAQRTQSDSNSGNERESSESETQQASAVPEAFKPAVTIEDNSVTLTALPAAPIDSIASDSSLGVSAAVGVSNVTVAGVAKSGADRSVVSAVSSTASAAAQGGSQSVTSSSSLSSTTQSPATQNASNGAESKSQVARPNSGTSISPYQEVKLVQRVLRGLEQLGDGGGQVKLRLHPPELGSLQLSLRMESGQMFAKLEVETTAARDTLLSNVQTLKDRLADQGIKVESFDVQLSTDSSGSGSSGSSLQQNGNPNANSSWENATSRYAQVNNNRLSSDDPPERAAAQSWSRTNGALDLTV